MEKIQDEHEYIKMDPRRYQFIFGYSNMVVVFHPKDIKMECKKSKDFDAVYSYEHNCNSCKDALLDISILVKTGQYDLKIRDVVAIKINGSISCFGYRGKNSNSISSLENSFYEIKDFVHEEKNEIIQKVHKENKVISVLDGEIIPVEDIKLDQNVLYAIDGEIFKAADYLGKGISTTDYSLYRLEKFEIENVNPYHKPFFNINVALYFFLNRRKFKNDKNKKPLLLFNRQELDMVKDFFQLNTLIG